MHAFTEKLYDIGIFLDLSKTFDTVNHSIQFSDHYNVRGVVLNWFYSYLRIQQSFVNYKSFYSDLKTITCGIPQGSLLGPLLLLLSFMLMIFTRLLVFYPSFFLLVSIVFNFQ